MNTKDQDIVIRAHKGPQETFLSSRADVVCFGGSAGGGKSWALLMEPLRYIGVSDYYCLIFRRHQTEITLPGGLADESKKLYPLLGGEYYSATKTWVFPSGAKVVFRGLELMDDMYQFKGVQVNEVLWDELTTFHEEQFWYLFSRIRSTNNIRGRVRASTNPESEGWVKDLIKEFWLDDDGYAIPEMSGQIKWFIRVGGDMHWYDTREDAITQGAIDHNINEEDILPTSFTFIRSSLDQNPSLGVDYKSKLMAMPEKDRLELMDGCWNFDASRGIYFKRDWVDVIEPAQTPLIKFKKIIISVDLAASPPSQTNRNPDWSVFLKMGMDDQGYIYVLDMIRMRDTIGNVKKEMLRYAQKNGTSIPWTIPMDPGGHGKHAFQDHVKNLSGFVVKKAKTEKSKLERFLPFASMAEHGLVKVVRADWNTAFFQELEGFIGDGKRKDDIVDTVSDGHKELVGGHTVPTDFTLNISAMSSGNVWDIN